MTRAEDFAKRIAWRWNNPGDQPRVYPSSITIEERADKTYWQATNMEGFTGDLAAWTALVRQHAGTPALIAPTSARTVAKPAPPPVADPAPKVQTNPYDDDL